MSTPTFPELDQLREAIQGLVADVRQLAAGAEQLPGRIAAITDLGQKALKQMTATTENAREEAVRVRREVDASVEKDTARAAEAAAAKVRVERDLATTSAALREAQAQLEATRAEMAKLKAQAHQLLTH